MPCHRIFMGLLLLCVSGCYADRPDSLGESYSFRNGNVSQNYGLEFAAAYRSTREALADLGLPILHEHYHGLSGEFETTTPEGDDVLVYVEEVEPMNNRHTSRVGVRVGFFGNSSASSRILEQVSARTRQINQPNISSGPTYNLPNQPAYVSPNQPNPSGPAYVVPPGNNWSSTTPSANPSNNGRLPDLPATAPLPY